MRESKLYQAAVNGDHWVVITAGTASIAGVTRRARYLKTALVTGKTTNQRC